ncbi:MAG: hypothetical protein R3Y54_12470 [Eubacteriales bacterium]
MKTMNEQDKNQMLQGMLREGESYGGKMWGVIMADNKALLTGALISGAVGALSNQYCYVGVTQKAIYFVVVGSFNVSEIKQSFIIELKDVKKAKVKKSLIPGRRVMMLHLGKGKLKLSVVNNTIGSDIKMQKEGCDYLCNQLSNCTN